MALLRFAPIGRTPLGRLAVKGNAQGNLTQAAGVGVAGAFSLKVDKGLTGVAGIGVAAKLDVNPATLLIGVAGTGVARGIGPEVDKTLTGVAGVGVAGSITLRYVNFLGASGTGVAGILFNSEQAFLLGVSGGGVAAPIIANPRGIFQGVSGLGVCGLLTFPTVGGQPLQAAGIGVAGRITAVISGGGGNGASAGDGDRRRRPRTGLEPIAKAAPPTPPTPRTIELPPEWLRRGDEPSLVPAQDPLQPVDHDFAAAMPGVAAQIADAQDITDMHRYLREQDHDEQDMADIADVLAMLD